MDAFRFRDVKAVSPVIAVILMVAITVVLASILYVWVMNLAQPDETIDEFAVIEVDITDKPAGDEIKIKMISGDPVDWSLYKILMTNESDVTNSVMLLQLEGESWAGDKKIFNATNTPNFDNIDYQGNLYYQMEIYNIKKESRVSMKEHILCKFE